MSTRRYLAMVFCCALASLTPIDEAQAAFTTAAPATLPISVATWSAVAVAPGAAVVTGIPHTLAWTHLNRDKTLSYDFFEIANAGSLTLNRQFLLVASTAPNGGAVPAVTLEVCVAGNWNPQANTCSSSNVVSLGTTLGGSLRCLETLSTTGRLSLRASTADVKLTGSRITTISVSVSRADIRTATSSDS